MDTDIVLLDLFSGIGGFSLGLSQAGFNITTHYYSEIDKHAIAIYKYQFKNPEYVGSVTTLDGKSITRPNIITFGSPCQDFSVAGKRTGLEGQRSSLIGEAIRLVAECKPDLFIWENVKGVFSSNNGADFWAVIQAFTNIGGYRLEWQLLNTAWFLPQNRERIYIIGHLAESKRNFRQIFPIGWSSRTDDGNEESDEATSVRTLQGGGHSGGNHFGMTIIRHRSNQEYKQGNISPSLRNSDKAEVRIVAQRGRESKILSPKRTEHGKKIRKKYEKGEIKEQRKNIQQLEPREDGKTNSLTGVQKDNLVVCDWRDDEGLRVREDKYGVPMVIEGERRPRVMKSCIKDENDISPTITATNCSKNADNQPWIDNNRRIRRLTPVECERLQGFPDNWTEYGDYDGEIKKVSDTQRYKTLGNAVTVKVVEEIGNRLK